MLGFHFTFKLLGLLEINKGPNMTPVSKKDYKLKYNIIEDVFDKVNFINKNNINLFNKI